MLEPTVEAQPRLTDHIYQDSELKSAPHKYGGRG